MTMIVGSPEAAPPRPTPLWTLCPSCRVPVSRRQLDLSGQVCPNCGRHGPLTAMERLRRLFDQDGVELLRAPDTGADDPLEFVDTKPYAHRLREARERTGLSEAVVCAEGTIGGRRLVAAVMDFRFLGGSLGGAVGELITCAAETALARRVPLLLVTASGGARMQEGALSLMQMAKTSQAIARLDEAGIATISLITDPTFGGVAASFATLSDVIIAEPGARLGFAGPRVIEQTIGQRLPDGFQTAEFLAEHGFVDLVCARSGLCSQLARLLAILGGGTRRATDPGEPDPVIRDFRRLPRRQAWEVVRSVRQIERPTTHDYIGAMLEDFVELHGDRLAGDCPAIIGGLGLLDGAPVVVIGHQKGRSTTELAARNYGMPSPAGYRKAARLMRLAAKLGFPVLTLIDTPGAYPGLEAEEQGQALAIAENLRLMSTLPVPVVAVVTGEGGSGGALALGVANRVLMNSNAVYSVISPEGCAAILWKDPAAAPDAAAALRLGARDLLRLGVVDGVVPEPPGGAGGDRIEAARRLRAAVIAQFRELAALGPAELVAHRRARFRAFGGSQPAPHQEGRDVDN